VVRSHDARAPGVGDHGKAAARSTNAGVQRGRSGEEFREILNPQRTGAPHGGVEHVVGANQGAGVRYGRPGCLCVAP